MTRRFSYRPIVRLLSSNVFFWIIIGLFIFQAVWIALTGRYPQAFDEQYHFGAIQLHARQLWWPQLSNSVMGANGLGDIARDPSFLYHYLMAIPYSLFKLVVSSQTTQLILLRLINVALAAWGFVLYRCVMREAGLSRAKTNILLLFVSLLPVFPLLAGQLNYDNLLFPLSGLTFLWVLRLYQQYQNEHRLNWQSVTGLVLLMLFTSMVKYTFLPICLGIVLCFIPALWRMRRAIPAHVYHDLVATSRAARVGYAVALVLGITLFVSSYGVNVVRYHNVNPSCSQVLSVADCSSYGPWLRDYLSSHDPNRVTPAIADIIGYPVVWAETMMRETFFTIYSNFDAQQVVHYHAAAPIRLLIDMGWAWFWVSLVVLVLSLPYLLRRGTTRLLLVVSLVYVAALFAVNIRDFLKTSEPVAIHGRYLFPVIFPLLICVVYGVQHLFTYVRQPARGMAYKFSIALVLLSVLIFTQGGGFITYIVWSNDKWFWPQSQSAQSVNATARRIFTSVVAD